MTGASDTFGREPPGPISSETVSSLFRLGAVAAAFTLLLPCAASAQDDGPFQGLKIAIPEARGRAAWGRAALSKSLRRTMVEAVGPLVSSRDLRKAQRKLKQNRRQRRSPKGLAAAGQAVGARYVLDVQITKKKWLYTATALLIDTRTGNVEMNFRSEYYKPKKDAADRGERIGKRTILKFEELGVKPGDSGGGAVVAAGGSAGTSGTGATKPGGDAMGDDTMGGDTMGGDDPDDLRVDDGTDDATAMNDTTGDPGSSDTGSTGDTGAVAMNDTSGGGSTMNDTASGGSTMNDTSSGGSTMNDTSSGGGASTGGGFSSSSGSNTVGTELTPEPEGRDDSEIIRISFGAGAGLLRRYDLAFSSGNNSPLSHQLEPLSLLELRSEFIAPKVPVSLQLNAAFRPVKYNITIPGEEDVQPSGSILDLMFLAGYHVGIAGSGRQTYKIIPSVGARFALSNVSAHQPNILLSTTTLAVIGGLGFRLPFNDVLELSFGVDGGLIVGYSEDPGTSGGGASGITIGGDLSVRLWLSDAIAIAIDNRFTFESVGFDGTPDRQLPESEPQDVQDATITTQDLRTSAGVAVRF